MSFPKLILIGSLGIFALIGGVAFFKKTPSKAPVLTQVEKAVAVKASAPTKTPLPVQTPIPTPLSLEPAKKNGADTFIDIDRIHQLFTTGASKLPIVETISYSSKVAWLKGRPAWIADYAAQYGTSRHFIARSLNNKPDYFTQKVITGSRFNVFRKDKKIDFHLLIDTSRCKMAFYYYDADTNERVLLKTYNVGLGKIVQSGSITPTGDFTLGNKVAIYKPGTMGYVQDKKIEMLRLFGTRWIPFESSEKSAKGYGIHGLPWTEDKDGKLVENRDLIGKFESNGSVCLSSVDMEELFAIVITKPTHVHIVKDFKEAKLPGIEVATPTR